MRIRTVLISSVLAILCVALAGLCIVATRSPRLYEARGTFYYGLHGREMESLSIQDWSGPDRLWMFKEFLWDKRPEDFEQRVLRRLCGRRLRHDKLGCGSAMSARSASLARAKAEFSVESVKEAVVRLKSANMADSAEIACEMLENLSSAQDVSVGKKEVFDLLDVVEELESRQIPLSNGVSVAARNFARLEGHDFKSSVDAICALRLFCATASAKLGGSGDVGSELWLVDSLTRAKTQLGKESTTEMIDILDLWIAKVWNFVDTHECNSYKMTRKLWDDALPHLLEGNTDDNYRKEFVGHVRRPFIDRIEKMSGGHIVPWEKEFTFSALSDRIIMYQDHNVSKHEIMKSLNEVRADGGGGFDNVSKQ